MYEILYFFKKMPNCSYWKIITLVVTVTPLLIVLHYITWHGREKLKHHRVGFVRLADNRFSKFTAIYVGNTMVCTNRKSVLVISVNFTHFFPFALPHTL